LTFANPGTLSLVFALDCRSQAMPDKRFSDLSRETLLMCNGMSAEVLCTGTTRRPLPEARPGTDFVIDCDSLT
jgi:hypothetical protein